MSKYLDSEAFCTAIVPRGGCWKRPDKFESQRGRASSSLDADWPPHQPITLMDLIAGARAVEWDFTHWSYVSGYDAGDPDARSMFECLPAYTRREDRAGLH